MFVGLPCYDRKYFDTSANYLLADLDPNRQGGNWRICAKYFESESEGFGATNCSFTHKGVKL